MPAPEPTRKIMAVPVVEIAIKNPDGKVTMGRINSADFNPTKHKLWEDRGELKKVAAPKVKVPPKGDPVREAIVAAQDMEIMFALAKENGLKISNLTKNLENARTKLLGQLDLLE